MFNYVKFHEFKLRTLLIIKVYFKTADRNNNVNTK